VRRISNKERGGPLERTSNLEEFSLRITEGYQIRKGEDLLKEHLT
jgi:hypothetical protein